MRFINIIPTECSSLQIAEYSALRLFLPLSLMLTPFTANSQERTSPTVRDKLIERGFTSAELADGELADVAPHYKYLVAWQKCVTGDLQAGIQMQGTAQQISSFTNASCKAQAGYLRASLGQAIGPRRAARVIASFEARVEIIASALRPDAPAGKASYRIRNWIVTPNPSLKSCTVSLHENGWESVRFIKNQNEVKVFLYSRSSTVPDAAHVASHVSENRYVMFEIGYQRYTHEAVSVDIANDSNTETITFSFFVTPSVLTHMKSSFGFYLVRPGEENAEPNRWKSSSFSFDGLGKDPINALLSC